MGEVHETGPRGSQASSSGTARARPEPEPLDDWLGEISDEDWSEQSPAATGRGHDAPAGPQIERWADPVADRPGPTRPLSADEAHRAVVERRRLVAGLLVTVVLGLGVAIPVLLLRDGGESTVTPAPVTTPTTTVPSPSAPPPSPPPASPTTTTTTPSPGSASGFTLPEGTKLQRGGEGDPAVIRELQRALVTAGYDPGPADGTFGERTEAAVVAFQQANGLSVDGRVGPETATALNSAVADG